MQEAETMNSLALNVPIAQGISDLCLSSGHMGLMLVPLLCVCCLLKLQENKTFSERG